MGKIKSTIDLIMEKTKGMEFSAEERKQMEEKKYLTRAEVLSKRYLNGDLRFEDLKKELAGYEEKEKNIITQNILRQLAQSLDITKNGERILGGIEILSQDSNLEVIDKIRPIFSEYNRTREDRYRNFADQMREKLSGEAISGSAVEPNVESNPNWMEALNRLNGNYREELEKLIAEFISKL
jgi:hypothetical protein